ncbi:MAG: polysaccharide export protein [Gemmatimonadetes bacterium]|nr:polysaccharide export protein [Gemmatimonadota bacterium]
MSLRFLRSPLVAACFFLPLCVTAQGTQPRPTPAQAQALLQTRPDLVEQLRQRFLTSGLTKEQVHARLRAAGYPEDMLDQYLPGATGGAAVPSDSVFGAVRSLGIADSTDISVLRSAGAPALSLPAANLAPVMPDTGAQVFGLDIFRSATNQFEPNLAGPVDAGYRLGPGDVLVLILTGDVQASYQLDITREGFVVIPQIGQLFVANLTLAQLQSVLTARLATAYTGIRTGATRFSISVARLRSNQVYVLGDVRRPASYVISSAGTALTALYAAGGPTINGSLRTVEVKRGGRLVDTLDVYQYLVHGDASHDVRLESGDVVFVGVHGARVRVEGEIARPAIYELKRGETLADLVAMAGGFRATAARQRITIERILPAEQRTGFGNDRVTVDVSADGMPGRASSSIALQNGDVVRVFAIAERMRNRIVVEGNVYQSGPMQVTPGMMLSDALRKAGLKGDTYLGEVLISRLQSDTSRIQLRAMLADTTGRVMNDIALREDDEIRVYSLGTFRPERYVAIGGAVKNGGRFPYREGMTLRDLILLADGVRESAYLKEAEIARLPTTREGGRTATTFRTPLDSSYLFERRPSAMYLGPPGLPTESSGAPEVLLRPYDNVLILQQPDWELQRTVTINGEVRFPGSYALERKTERVSDLIKRAGGLTQEAYPDGVIFVRAQNGVGRVGIDLPVALRNYDANDNLILRDGDAITIPPHNAIVVVGGAVNRPAALAYVAGKGIDYYVDAAGGAARNGDGGRAYVVQPGGRLESVRHHFLRPNSMPEPKAGSTVTVPELDPADKKDYIALTGTVAQIIASTVAIIVAIKR